MKSSFTTRCVRPLAIAYGGALKNVAAPMLGATVIRESLKRSGLGDNKIQQVIMGNVIQG